MDEFCFEELFPSHSKTNNQKMNGKSFYDYEIKTIGDRVEIIDFFSVTHETGEEIDDIDFKELYDNEYFVVVETNQNVTYKTKHHEYKQDLIIANPKTKKLYRIALGHVKLHIPKSQNKNVTI